MMDAPIARITCTIEKPASCKRDRNSDSVRSRPLVKTIINMSISAVAGSVDDRRYDTVFVYHNGAESYYAARAFGGSLRV
jgi:hypothetical protein